MAVGAVLGMRKIFRGVWEFMGRRGDWFGGGGAELCGGGVLPRAVPWASSCCPFGAIAPRCGALHSELQPKLQ